MKYLLLFLLLFSSTVHAAPPYNPEASAELKILMAFLGQPNQHAWLSDQETAKRCDEIRHLLKYNADPNSADINGFSPIHWVAGSSDLELMVDLLRLGANANALTIGGMNALHYAANQSHKNFAGHHIAILLLYGADAHQRTAGTTYNQIPIETALRGTISYFLLQAAMNSPIYLLREIIHFFVCNRGSYRVLFSAFFELENQGALAQNIDFTFPRSFRVAFKENLRFVYCNEYSSLNLLQSPPFDEETEFYRASPLFLGLLYNSFAIERPADEGGRVVVNNFYSTLLSITHGGGPGLPPELWRSILFFILALQYQGVLG